MVNSKALSSCKEISENHFSHSRQWLPYTKKPAWGWSLSAWHGRSSRCSKWKIIYNRAELSLPSHLLRDLKQGSVLKAPGKFLKSASSWETWNTIWRPTQSNFDSLHTGCTLNPNYVFLEGDQGSAWTVLTCSPAISKIRYDITWLFEVWTLLEVEFYCSATKILCRLSSQ